MDIQKLIDKFEKELEFNISWHQQYTRDYPLTSIASLYLGRCTMLEEILKDLYKEKIERAWS